jgi:ornithine cyclodeaminase/alanine dehydrogenase-like protein (mu-crystallin family)
VLVLSEAEVRSLLTVDRLMERISDALIAVTRGDVSVPPRVAATVPDRGFTAAMPGYVNGVLETKLVSVFPDNERRGLPSHQAVIVALDAETGTPLALMDGTWITACRTAATSALATRALARPDAEVLAVIGTGVQARSHVSILPHGHPFREIRVAGRTPRRSRQSRRRRERQRVPPSPTPCAAPTSSPSARTRPSAVIERRWLAAGTHVNSIGYNENGGELDEATIRDGRLVVESRVAFEPLPAGARELQGLEPSDAVELGEILSGNRRGRTSTDQITVYKSMGHAAEDAAAAGLVLERAREVEPAPPWSSKGAERVGSPLGDRR